MPFTPGSKVTASEAAANYVSGAGTKGSKWATNYLRPKVDPFDAAAAAADRWLANTTTAGVAAFTAGVNRAKANENAIADNVTKNGATRYTQGVQSKSYKYSAAMANLLPQIQSIAASLPPRGDLEANIARAAQQQRQMAALRGKYRG